MTIVESRSDHFNVVRSSLMKLCGYYYPFMMPPSDCLNLSIIDELKTPTSNSFWFEFLYCLILFCSFVLFLDDFY